MRLIDADAMLATIRPDADEDTKSAVLLSDVKKLFRNAIANAPTIGPESLRPQGRWAKRQTNVGEETYCTACGKEAEILQDGGGCELLSDYCPNCGCRMVEVE